MQYTFTSVCHHPIKLKQRAEKVAILELERATIVMGTAGLDTGVVEDVGLCPGSKW